MQTTRHRNRSHPARARPPSLLRRRVRPRPSARREPADYDVATDATPRQVMRIFPADLSPSARNSEWCWSRAQNATDIPDAPSDGTSQRRRGRDLPLRRRLLRWPPSRRSPLHQDPREDVQRRDFTINGMMLDPLHQRSVLDFVGGRDDLQSRNHSRHRRSRTPFRRRQTAHAARRAFCRALRLPDRSRDLGGDPETGAPNSPGLAANACAKS